MKPRKTRIIRYSEAFKHQVVKEIEDGKFSLAQVKDRYGIKGADTIQNWIRRMGKLESLPILIRVEKPDEKDQIKELQRQIQQLKDSLAETQVRFLIAESQFEVVCEQQGLDPEEVKKKLKDKPSSKQ